MVIIWIFGPKHVIAPYIVGLNDLQKVNMPSPTSNTTVFEVPKPLILNKAELLEGLKN